MESNALHTTTSPLACHSRSRLLDIPPHLHLDKKKTEGDCYITDTARQTIGSAIDFGADNFGPLVNLNYPTIRHLALRTIYLV